MWIVHEGIVKLYDADVLFLLLLSPMLATACLLLIGRCGTKIDMIDVSMQCVSCSCCE